MKEEEVVRAAGLKHISEKYFTVSFSLYIFLEDVFFEKDWKSEAVRAAGSNRNFLQKLFCRK